jgi:hypothetical protein
VLPQATLGPVDANLSTAPIDKAGTGATVFAMLCDLLRTEQGHLYASTTGTLLAPTTQVIMRARARPATPALTLDAAADVTGVPQFDHDITNLVGTVSASGPTNSATAADATVIARVGNANTSETVNLLNPGDLLGWAQDRLNRGKNVALKVTKVDVDTLTSSISAAQILALVPGDRVRISNLTAGPLGFTQWDGWYLGADETHTFQSDQFTLYLAPVLPTTAVFDTDLFADGGTVTLNAAITATATTMTVASSDGITWFEQTALPYVVRIDSELVSVVAAAAPSGGSQTITITRGGGGTTAATHAAGAIPEIASTSNTFAF